MNNLVWPITLGFDCWSRLKNVAIRASPIKLVVDIESLTITVDGQDPACDFNIDPFDAASLRDEETPIQRTLRLVSAIEAYERYH